MSHRNRTRRTSSPSSPRRSLLKSLAGLFGRSDRSSELRQARTQPGRRSSVESLERRDMLAVISAGPAANNGIVDTFELVQNLGVPGNVDVYVNGAFTGTLVAPTDIQVFGSNDDDVLTVNSANGLINLPGGIRFFGGAGQDGLVLTQGGVGPVRDSERVEPGASLGQGTSIISDGGVDQIVYFEDLEPIQSNVPAATFTIAAFPAAASILQGDNAINYSAHPLDNTYGRVTIDSFEPIDFQNKGSLVIDAGSGDDIINISNPNTPTGLTGITVNGGSPGASDTLIVETAPGVLDSINVTPTAQGAGTVALQLGLLSMTYTGIEEIQAVLQMSEDDTFSIDGTAGDDLFQSQLTNLAGSAVFTGIFDQGNATGAGPFTIPRIVVNGDNPAFGVVGIFNATGAGGSDELRIQGTDSDEQFSLTDLFGLTNIQHSIGNTLLHQIVWGDSDTTAVTIDMGGGSDQATVVPELAFTNVLGTFPVVLSIQGGGSDDRLLVDESARAFADARTYNVLPLSGNNQRTAGNITGQNGGGDFTLGLTYEGIEQIQMVGDGDDTLSVRDDGQDSVWTLSAGPTILLESGRIGINDRSPVDFESFRRVELENTGGVDRFIVSPDRLPAFSVSGNQNTPPAEYQVIGGNTAGTLRDTLQIDGTGRDDAQQVVLTSTAITLGRTVGFTDVAAIEINTAAGDDTLEIDTTGGFVAPHVVFDGGSGRDTLLVSEGSVADEVQFYSGPIDNTGRLVYEDAANVRLMEVDYANLEPVLDNVVAAMLTVFGTNASNQISLSNGPGGLFFGAGNVTGLVGVDAFETLEFTQKTQVAIAAGGGADSISINLPNTPLGLSTLVGTPGILIDGQGPASGDSLLVNGTQTTVAVTLGALNSTIDGAAGTAALPVRIQYSGVEGLNVNADAATTLAVSGAAAYVHSVGAATDAGDLLADNFPIHYSQLGAGETLALTSPAVGALTMNGTAGNDQYVVLPNAAPNASIQTAGRATLNTAGITALTINSGDGEDQFQVQGDAIFAGGITLQTGTASANDTVILSGSAAPSVIDLDIAPLGDSVTGIVTGTINLLGISVLAISGGGAADTFIVDNLGIFSSLTAVQFTGDALDTMTVNATAFDDVISVRPHSPPFGTDMVETRVNDRGPTVYSVLFGAPANAFVIDGSNGSDTLNVLGSTAADTIDVDGARVAIAGLRQVNYAGVEALRVLGDAGADVFNVTPSAVPTFIDGGDPIGAGDVLNLVPAVTNVTLTSGPESDEGQLSDGVNAAVSYDRIEGISITGDGTGTATINGTNADNDITIIGTAANAFTASVDGGPAVLFTDMADVVVNALAGDDDVDVTVGLLAINSITINGGDPTASDELLINGTAGGDAVVFTPTSSSSGSLTGLATPVTFSTTEHVVYHSNDDQGLDDVTINGTDTNDSFDFDAVSFQGRFRSALSPEFDTRQAGRITVTGGAFGADVVNLLGSAGADTVTSAANAVSILTSGSFSIVTLGAGIDALTVSTLADADSINLSGVLAPITTTVFGGAGDDEIVGSPQADLLYGGDGNDVIIGGGGADVGYGEAGNDRFGDPTAADPAANDAGNDQFFGGDGSDTLVWDPGDGSDLFEGGDGVDAMIFNGGAGVETFTFNAVGSRLEFLRSVGAIDMDLADVEQVNLNANGGADAVVVNDLFGTGVQTVSLNLGTDGSTDSVTVNGRTTNDSLMLTSPAAGQLLLNGLTYTVGLATTEPTDVLTLNGNAGDDQITAAPGAEAIMTITLNGGLGNDSLTGNVPNLFGNEGDDLLVGGLGNQTFDGGEGDDTFVGNGGSDNVGGGAGSSVGDTILLAGTAGADTFALSLSPTGQLIATINGLTTTYANFIGGPIATSGIEQILVQGLAGNDSLTVDSANGAISIPINYAGGDNADLLTLTGGVADSNTYQVGPGVSDGTSTIVIGGVTQVVRFSNLEPVLDLVGGPLTVVATNAANMINYSQGSVAANGLVSVDGFETIEFSNKTVLTINALAGDDHVNLNNANTPTGLTAINVNGGDPSASDTVVVHITADTVFAPTSSSSATVNITGLPLISLATVEGVTIAGNDANLNLTVQTLAGFASTTLTPGATGDSGDVQVDSLVPMNFTNLGLGGSLVLDDVDSAALNDPASNDQFIYNGTEHDDFFFIDSTTGRINLNFQIVVVAGDVAAAAVRGANGTDNFTQIGGDAFEFVAVEGGGPDDGDALNLVLPTGALFADLENSFVTGFNGLGTTFYSGLETVALDAAGETLLVRASGGNDRLEVTPTGPDAGFMQNNGLDPVLFYRGVAANTVSVDLNLGDDTLVVHGSAAANTIDVDVPAGTVTVDGAIIDFNPGTPDDLVVNGGADADTFNVLTGAIPVMVDGGSPIGTAGGDLLFLNLAVAGVVTAEQGPESDEGSFTVDADAPLSFDHLEGVTVNGLVGSTLFVLGTNADDDITITGTGDDDFTLSVNAGPAIQYNDFTTAQVDGLAGDDDFDVAVNGLNATAFNLVGGSPAATGDSVTVTGLLGGADNAAYQPLSADSGTLAVAGLVGANAIFVTGVESLSYDGGSEDETLTVLGTADDDTIVHTPGAAIDAGGVGVNSLLPISYANLGAAGTVAIDGQAGSDLVVARGTNGDDDFDVAATLGSVTLQTILGQHVVLTRVDATLEDLMLDGLDGNDSFTVNADQPYAFLDVLGGSPGGSDSLFVNDVVGADDAITVAPSIQRTNGTIIVNALVTGYAGIEHIFLSGSGDVDALTVLDNAADNQWEVLAGAFGDLIQIDNLETINYGGFDAVTLVNNFGTDVFRVHPTDLVGYITSLTIDGDGDDKLELVGANIADTFSQTAATQFTVNAKPVDFTDISTLQLTGLQNTDTFNADISTLAGGVTNLVVDGGEPSANSDTVNLTVAANARITQSIDPQSGTVDNAGAVVVNYVALESLNIVSNTAASTLLVRGTNDADQIAIQGVAGNPNQGRVWIGGGTVMTLNGVNANFANLTVQGRFGDDHFSVTPIANVTVNVEGNDPTASDTVVVNVVSNTTFAPLSSSSATVTSVGFLPVNLSTVEGVTIGGNDGNLTLNVQTPAGAATTTLTPGGTPDAGSIQVDSLVPLAFTNLGVGGTLVLVDADANDTFVYLGTDADDDIFVSAAGVVSLNAQIAVDPSQAATLVLKGLNGFDLFTVVGTLVYDFIDVEGDGPADGDTLFAATPVGPAIVDWDAAQVLGFGAVINYTGLVAIGVDAGNAVVEVRGTLLDDDITVTPTDANSGLVVDNWAFTPDVFYFTTGGNAVHIDAAGGEDTVAVVGNALSQTFDIDIPASSVSIDDLNNAVNDGIVTWENNESLEVYGLQGDDTFNVVAGDIPLFVDGGDPIGQTAGDRFNMLAGGGVVTFEAGPENDEGGILIGSNARISYDHIEAGQVTDAECILIMGTNGDDDITVIARTELQNPLRYATADGNKDFTTTVNGGIEILWVNNNPADLTVDLFVDALSGDDDIVFRAPALDPNNGNAPIAWNVTGWIVGGSPSTVTGDQGDVFELGTPGQNEVRYTPNGYSTGVIELDSANAGVFDTVINLVENFAIDCDNNGINEYVSSDGGIEQFNYDGEGTDDVFTVVDTAGNDVITHTPGVRTDEGSVRVNDLLAVNYENLGQGATFTIGDGGGRLDTLVALGTGGSDTLTASRESALIGLIDVNSQISIRTDNIEIYTLDGLEGNDLFEIRSLLADAVDTVNTEGGGPGGSDVLEVFGVNGAADVIEVRPGETRTDGEVDVNALLVNYSGVEHIQLQAGFDAGDALTVRATTDLGDNLWVVNAGDYGGDRIQIDNRESIEYRSFDTVALVNEYGTDHFRISPTSLSQYLTSFTVTGDAFGGQPIDDVLELVGTPANDVVTSTATAVSINGQAITAGANLIELQVNTLSGDDRITLSLNLAGTRKVIDAGDGNDNVDVSTMVDATIFGGLGDDIIVGSPIADLIYGGSGNDTISGLGGNDTIYGGEGNDVITGGTGNDNLFGGDGSDRFIWNQFEDSDIVEGDEGVDVQIVNGAAAGDAFLLRTKTGDESRAFFERTNLAAFSIDMGKVEQVDMNTGDGADTVEVRDLFTTDVTVVNTNVGVDVLLDTVTVQGRSVSDDVTLSYYAAINGVNIAGMKYDVNVAGLDPVADLDTLTFNANDGDDTVIASDALNIVFGGVFANVNRLIINGGDGDDSLTGFGNLNGNDGQDFLVGGASGQLITGGEGDDMLYGGGGDDFLNGNEGEDTFVGGAGADTIDGGDVAGNIEWDTILVVGTSANDTIDVTQTSATSVTYRVNADTQTDTLVTTALPVAGTRTVDEIRVEAGAGADLIRVRIADALAVDAPFNHLVTVVHGGTATAAGDRLVMIDDGVADLTLYRKGQDVTEGNVTIGPGNAESFETAFDGIERVQFLDSNGVAINQDPNSSNSGGNPANRLVMFTTDMYEYNDDRFLSTQLGVPTTTTLVGTIDPGAILNPFGDGMNIPGDEDWFKVQANVTGTLDFQTMFDEIGTLASGRPGLPGNGDLDIYLYDADGTMIAGNGPLWGGNNGSGANPENNTDGDVFAENERIRIPAVQGQTYYLQVIGRNGVGPNPDALTGTINAFTLNVINTAVAVPFDLELQDNPVNGTPLPPGQNQNSDTGRNQFDNHTYDNTPTIIFRLDDGLLLNDMPGNNTTDTPPDEVISIPFQPGVGPNGTQPTSPGYAIAIFDEGSTAPASGNAGGTNIRQPLGFAIQLEPGLYSFTVPAGMALNDGSHFITARTLIIDPANPQQSGWGARSDSFEIVVDRVAPPVFFGYTGLGDTQHGLAASSDSGVNGYPATNVDRVTNDTTPTFYGTGEANSIVRLYVETNGVAGLQSRESGAVNPDLFIGLTVSNPLDGSNQFPAGNWELTSQLDLNNPNLGGFFTQDGVRRIYVTGEDLAGNITPDGNADVLNIFLDTRGPQVSRVDVNTRNNAAYNIWDHKGKPDGGNDGFLVPTPLVNSLVISVQDLPNRSNVDPNFLYEALFTPVSIDPGQYVLVGDHNGIIPIQSITFTSDPVVNGVIATGFVTLSFFEPLPDDRFTLTLKDGITDRVGNKLDGEANTNEPHDTQGTLPSGDGVPGGNFVARFTVDSRAEIGSWGAESAWVDTNGNFTFDPENADFVNRDIQYKMEWVDAAGTIADKVYTSDNVFAGKFTPAGAVAGNDGFDKLGAYGRQNGGFRWLIDTNNDGVADVRVFDPANINGVPVAGNFDGNAANGDEVGVFTGTSWWLDTNHDYLVDTQIVSVVAGYPIVGDFDGDGLDDLGAWQQDRFQFDFASNGLGVANANSTINFGFIGVRERPVAADMDGDGIDDIGLWVPDNTAPTTSATTAEWYFLTSNFPTPAVRAAALGNVNLLNHAFTPVPFGKDLYAAYGDEFAVPLVGNFDPPPTTTGGTDGSGNPVVVNLDVNRDGSVTPLDALIIINALNSGNGEAEAVAAGYRPDVDGSGSVVPLDALYVINALNGAGGEGEGEAAAVVAVPTSSSGSTVATSAASAVDALLASGTTVKIGATPALIAQIVEDDSADLIDAVDSLWSDVAEEDDEDSLASLMY
ncbi:MAG: dockerin type I domain-containing protein [Pirellulales bacterium]